MGSFYAPQCYFLKIARPCRTFMIIPAFAIRGQRVAESRLHSQQLLRRVSSEQIQGVTLHHWGIRVEVYDKVYLNTVSLVTYAGSLRFPRSICSSSHKKTGNWSWLTSSRSKISKKPMRPSTMDDSSSTSLSSTKQANWSSTSEGNKPTLRRSFTSWTPSRQQSESCPNYRRKTTKEKSCKRWSKSIQSWLSITPCVIRSEQRHTWPQFSS